VHDVAGPHGRNTRGELILQLSIELDFVLPDVNDNHPKGETGAVVFVLKASIRRE